MRQRAIPQRALRRVRPAGDPVRTSSSSGATKPERPPISMLRLHSVMRCSIGMARDGGAGIFDHVAARAGDAELGDDAQRHVLGGDMRRQPCRRAGSHALRPLHRHHLRRQDVRELGGAAAEGQRAEPADRAGVAVGHRMRRARQHHAELRRDHVRDALLGIVEVEHPDAVPAAALAHRPEEGRARRIGVVVAAGLGGDGMVLHREGQVGPPHRTLLLRELLERVRRVQLVQHVAVDIDQLAAVGAARHADGASQILSNRVWGMTLLLSARGERGRIAYSGVASAISKVSWAS